MVLSHGCSWWGRRSPWSTRAGAPIIIILGLLVVVHDGGNSLAGQGWGAWDTVSVLYPAVTRLIASSIHPYIQRRAWCNMKSTDSPIGSLAAANRAMAVERRVDR